jgi:hypothetical protein
LAGAAAIAGWDVIIDRLANLALLSEIASAEARGLSQSSGKGAQFKGQFLTAFRQGLNEAGLVADQNIEVASP